MPKDVIQALQNRLLASLAPSDYDVLRADLEPITLSYRASLYRSDGQAVLHF